MSCGLEKDLLSGYLDDELEASERDAVERHIQACSGCLRDLGDLKGAVLELKSLPREAAPAGVREGAMRQIASGGGGVRRWFQGLVAAAAVALVAVSLAVIARQEPSPAPRPAAGPAESLALKKKDAWSGDTGERDRIEAKGRRSGGELQEQEKSLQDLEAPAQTPAAPSARPEGEPPPEGSVPGGVRGGAPPPAVFTLTPGEGGALRPEVEALLLKLGLAPKAGPAEHLGDAGRAKDEYLTVELSDADLEAVRRRVADLKGTVAETTLAKERERLTEAEALLAGRFQGSGGAGTGGGGTETAKAREERSRGTPKPKGDAPAAETRTEGFGGGKDAARPAEEPVPETTVKRRRVILRFAPPPPPPAGGKK